jgi:DNA-binding winged helix-turn-helix (wHTH) protein
MLPWTFVDDDLRLVSVERSVRLTPRSAAVLRCLMRHRGEVVTREALLAEVWSGLHVSPDLPRECIFDLRVALGDDARSPGYIETVRGRGFRLIGPVERERPPAGKGAQKRRATVAVLRPEAAPRWRRFARALTDDMTSCLAGFGDIAVTAHRSAYAVEPGAEFAVARALGADYLVESSVAAEGDLLRCRFQLVDGRTGTHVWARHVDRPLARAIEPADELAATVANWVGGWRGAVLVAEHARASRLDEAALGGFDYYVLACGAERVRDREHAGLGLRLLERSLALDPDNPRAWLLLFYILMRPFMLFGEPVPAGDQARAEAAVAQAQAVGPEDALVLAEVCSRRARQGDMCGALTALDRAIELGGGQAETMTTCADRLATVAGDAGGARRLIDRAHRLNPSPKEWCRFAVARVAFFSGDFEACAEAAGRDPELLPRALFGALALAMLGRTGEAAVARCALATRFPRFRFGDYAAAFPIVAPEALALYEEGVRRLRCRSSRASGAKTGGAVAPGNATRRL